MTGRTHVAAGAAAGLVAASLLGRAGTVPAIALAAAGGALGGVLPDLDVRDPAHPTRDRLSRVVVAALLLGALLLDATCGGALLREATERGLGSVAIGAAGLAALCCAARLSAHRSFSHSLVALCGFSLSVWAVCPPLAAPVAAGLASHLALDLLNHRPVRLLWPLRRGLCLGICRAGGVVDALCLAGAVLVAARVTLGAAGLGPVA